MNKLAQKHDKNYNDKPKPITNDKADLKHGCYTFTNSRENLNMPYDSNDG
jgi:hypothetical protein